MIQRQPFETTKLQEDRDEPGTIITVRVNKEEREMIDKIKSLLNVSSDSKALKVAAAIGQNVIHSNFTDKTIRYLTGIRTRSKQKDK